MIPCPLVSAGTDFPDAARFSAETTACPAATRCRTSRSSPSCRGAAGQSDYSLGPPYSTVHIKRHAILHRNQAGRKCMSRPVAASPSPSGSAPPSALSCPDGSDALAPPDRLPVACARAARCIAALCAAQAQVPAARRRRSGPASGSRVGAPRGAEPRWRGEWLRCGPTCDRMTVPAVTGAMWLGPVAGRIGQPSVRVPHRAGETATSPSGPSEDRPRVDLTCKRA